MNMNTPMDWIGQDPKIKPLVEQDPDTLQRMFPEIPLWVKSPDFDRVKLNQLLNYTAFPFLGFWI